jgi:polyhydroxybutyrate depolymerase
MNNQQCKEVARRIIAITFLMAATLISACRDHTDPKPDLIGAGDFTRKLTVDGRERAYFIHVPTAYNGSKPFPVVLLFHGGGSNAPYWMSLTSFNQTADQHSFIAVYPNGTGETVSGIDVLAWNGGPRQPYGLDSTLSKVDDVGFTRAVLDDLGAIIKINKKRVYATGMSAGAILTYRLASELSDRIAAIAPVAGPMGTETIRPERPVSVIHFHGTADEAVPFTGGKGRLDPTQTDFQSVDYSIQSWVRANGCQRTPTITPLPEIVNDGTRVIRQAYTGGRGGSEVVLYVIEGGGHTWPGRPYGPGLEILGKATENISANEVMWTFFEKHPME